MSKNKIFVMAILLVILSSSLFLNTGFAAGFHGPKNGVSSGHPVIASPHQSGSILDQMKHKYLRDVKGNTLAVVVLLGMLTSLVLVAYNFVMGDPAKVKPWPRWVIPVLAILGMGVAIYMTFVETTKASAFCGPIGDCNSVQKSSFSLILGILPVGVLGLLGYFAILAAWIVQLFTTEKWRNLLQVAIWGMAIFGVLFSIYLTFLEPFVIGATCIWCISSAIIITLLLWASTPLAKIATSSSDDLQDEYSMPNA